jgi:CRP/FNR family transcriptional regulator
VFAGKHFPAFAETLEASRIFFFPRNSFIVLIQKEPSLALNMLAILSSRLRQFAQLVESLSLKEVPGRLAAYLLYLSEQKQGSSDLELDISKGQLASVLGTIPETLSRMLARMTAQKLIQVNASQIKIVNRRDWKIWPKAGNYKIASVVFEFSFQTLSQCGRVGR